MSDEPENALPRAVALAWGVAAQPQRGPKREMSVEKIVDAAIEVADAEGIGAVSMARVAASLGYTTMSLYRYVTSKDELVVLMADAASAITIPAEDAEDADWRTGLRSWVQATMQAYREHPWLIDMRISGAPVTPNSLMAVDWILRILRPLALTDGEKISTLLLLTALGRAFATFERDLAPGPGTDPAGLAEALKELVTSEEFPDLYPVIQAGGYIDADAGEQETWTDLEFALERVFDGIQHRVEGLPSPVVPVVASADALDGLIRSDKAVREAARERREAERRLRESRKREREAMARVRERHRNSSGS